MLLSFFIEGTGLVLWKRGVGGEEAAGPAIDDGPTLEFAGFKIEAKISERFERNAIRASFGGFAISRSGLFWAGFF